MMSHSCTDMHWTNICILPMLPMLLWKKSFSRLCSPLPKGLTQTVGVSGFYWFASRTNTALTETYCKTCCKNDCNTYKQNQTNVFSQYFETTFCCGSAGGATSSPASCAWAHASDCSLFWRDIPGNGRGTNVLPWHLNFLLSDEVYWLLNSSRAKVNLWFKGKQNGNARWHFQQSRQVWVNRETFRQEPEVSVLSKCKEPRCYQHDPSRL